LYVEIVTEIRCRRLITTFHVWKITLPVGHQYPQCGARVALTIFGNIICWAIASECPPANLAFLLFRRNAPDAEIWSYFKSRPITDIWRVNALILKIGNYAPAFVRIPTGKFFLVHFSLLQIFSQSRILPRLSQWANKRLPAPRRVIGQFVSADLAVQRGAFDAEDAGGAAFVPAGVLQGR